MPVSSTPALLGTLALDGQASRASLARALGISRQGASASVRPLLAAELIEETTASPGSRRTELRLTPRAGLLGSVVITWDNYAACLTTLDGQVLGAKTGPLPQADAHYQLQTGLDALSELLQTWRPAHGSTPLSCHLSVPTQCDTRTGQIFPSPASQHWVGVNPLEEASQVLDADVVIENTTRLEAYAEHLAHESAPGAVTCYARFSHGVAMGQVVDGKILAGGHGGAGELGHTVCEVNGPLCTCGNRGCLMQYASLPAVDRTLREQGLEISAAEALSADPDSLSQPVRDVLYHAGQVAGRALANVANLLDPDLLVVGGELGAAPGPFFQALRSTVEQTTLPLISTSMSIRQALSDHSPQAAASVAVSALREDRALIEAQIAKLDLG